MAARRKPAAGKADTVRAHFAKTLGQVPAAVETLARYAPDALQGYLAFRQHVHEEPPKGHLDAATRELLFVALDVVEGHVEAAKAHAEQALKAGASVEAIAQALVIAMMISGIHTWSMWGHEVVEHAAKHAAKKPAPGKRR